MSKVFKLGDNLSIHVVREVNDDLLTWPFFESLYSNVFMNEENNRIAGLVGMNNAVDAKAQIQRWLLGTSEFMFFLYKHKKIIGTAQAFSSPTFGPKTLSLGYIISPSEQGQGYGTVMLKFVSEHLHDAGKDVVLGFRDGNVASERIAAKNNYSYLMRLEVPDVNQKIRPMTYYKYNGKPIVNENYSVIPQSKILTTNQWVEDGTQILSRVNPKMLSLEEYVYLTNSVNKPISLNETYFLFSTAHYGLKDKLKKEKVRTARFAMTDKASRQMFNPSKKGDIVLHEFSNLVDSDLNILNMNEDKTSMVLGNDIGEVKVKVLDNMLLVEEFVLTE